MKKKLIRLTESDLHNIVKESVNRILKEIATDENNQPKTKPVIKLTTEEMDELANNTVKYACDVAGFEDAFGHREDGDFDNCFEIGNYEISVSGYCFMEGGECISRGDYWNEPEYADTYYDFSLHDVVIYDKTKEQEFVLSKEDFNSLEEKIKEML